MRFVMIAALALTMSACTDDDPTDSTDSTDSTDDTDPVETVSLTDDVMPIMTEHCAGCHKRVDGNDNATRNGRFFEEKGDILGLVGTFIVAGDSASSGLVGVVAGETPVGMGPTTMPPFGDGVPQAQVDTVALWIDEGAKDN